MAFKDYSGIDTAQRILDTWKALRDKRLKVAPHFHDAANELINAPLTAAGLVDTSGLSKNALAFGRIAGMLTHTDAFDEKAVASKPISISDSQSELFQLFAQLFGALTGRSVDLISNEGEIKQRMLWRIRHEPDQFSTTLNAALDELVHFYNTNAIATFQYAKSLGGMRLVTGGQRTFGPSALNAVRITGLYADTQLIPDPVFPYLTADLNLNAKELQLALNLFHILQLRPLIDAEFLVPPVVIFPSFEEMLEEHDARTKFGMEELAVRMVGPLCNGSIQTLDEVYDYAQKHDSAFSMSLLASGLFIPPGGLPGKVLGVDEAVRDYLSALKGIRSDEALNMMRRLPTGALLLNGVLERLRPHYHLIDNANELGAQPLLSQPVHWHYFKLCASANAQDLRRAEILSEQAFQTLKAAQDDSLSWLANIPVQTLSELIANNEHRWLREELNKYTSHLMSGTVINTNEVIREVSHGLDSLIQRQQKAMHDIERKYSPKKAAVYTGGVIGIGLAATATLLPSLAPLIGALPGAIAAGSLTAGLIGYSKEKVSETIEKRQSQRSMLGVLALARPR